jgi:hypothetical protein
MAPDQPYAFYMDIEMRGRNPTPACGGRRRAADFSTAAREFGDNRRV